MKNFDKMMGQFTRIVLHYMRVRGDSSITFTEQEMEMSEHLEQPEIAWIEWGQGTITLMRIPERDLYKYQSKVSNYPHLVTSETVVN